MKWWPFKTKKELSPEEIEFEKEFNKVIDVLMENKAAIVLINGKPFKVWLGKGFLFRKVHIEEIKDYKIDF